MSDQLSATEVASLARARLEKVVADGIKNTGPLVERVLSEVPTDRIVKGNALGFSVGERSVTLFHGGAEAEPLHANAFAEL